MGKEKPLPQALFSLGLIDDGTAKLLEAKWNVPLPTVEECAAGGGHDPTEVVSKLTQLGWSENDAKKAVASTALPAGATTEEVVKTILAKLH